MLLCSVRCLSLSQSKRESTSKQEYEARCIEMQDETDKLRAALDDSEACKAQLIEAIALTSADLDQLQRYVCTHFHLFFYY